jgi:hypothetical protein
MEQDRLETNPVFGRRKLKFGTFQTNLDSGCVMSGLDGRLEITWPNTMALARLERDAFRLGHILRFGNSWRIRFG